MKKKWILLILFFAFVFSISSVNAYSPLFNDNWGIQSEVLSYPALNATAIFNGNWGIQSEVLGGGGGASMASNFSGTWGIKSYSEYYVYTDWSDWWIMHNYTNPVITNENPLNNSVGNGIDLTWNCTIQNPDGNLIDWSIECSNGQTNNSNGDTNGSKEISLTGLSYQKTYTVWVNVSHNITEGNFENATFYFTTLNPPPALSNENPGNNTYVPASFTPLSIDISDPVGELMDWSIQLSDGTTSSNVNSGNGTKTHAVALDYGESYKWWVNITDGTNWVREWYVFNTYSNTKPLISNPVPTNNSLGNNITTTNSFTIDLSDAEGDQFNWTIECSSGDSASGNLHGNGTKTCTLTTPLSYNTQYKVWVNVTDPAGSGLWNYSWFLFDTEVVGGNPPTITINATTGVEETNATGNAYVSASVFPANGWFRYRPYTTGTLSSTAQQALGIGEFDYNITSLIPGTYYYLQARASNPYGTNSTAFINFLTKPDPPSSLISPSYNDTYVNLTWNKGTGANTTVLERNIVENWARGAGAELYNGTGSTYNDTAVNPASTYYYQTWSWAEHSGLFHYSDVNISFNISTPPQPPQNVDHTLLILTNNTANLTLNWNKGTGADTTLIRKDTDMAPDDVTDGDLLYNSTGTSDTDSFINEPFLYTLWSWNSTVGLYSDPVFLGWYASWINVYNESKPNQAVNNWSIEISNQDGSEVYANNDNNNPLIINISDMPTGDNIGFSFSASGYKNRVYQKDVSETGAISLNAYLPPNYVPTTDPGGGGGSGGGSSGQLRYHTETGNISDYNTDETINLDFEIHEIDVVDKYQRMSYDRFLHADSKTVTDSNNDLDMTLNFTCDEIYQIIAYENLNSEDVYTDSASVTNPAVDTNISFSNTPVAQVIGVYIYNDTIYGGWIWVSADNYSYDSSNLTVNNTVMDDNTSMIKVDYVLDTLDQGVVERPIPHDKVSIAGYTATINKTALNSNTTLIRIEYYTYINEYYTWVDIPKQKYTNNSNSVTINQTQLDENTLLIRVRYYSYDDSTVIEPKLYILQVIDPSGSSVDDAKVIVKRYINTTGVYEEVGSYITDGNGQIEIFLIPFVNYKVQINASDQGFETDTYDYTPSDSVFLHKFKISIAETTPSEENMFTGIEWNIDPDNHYQRSNFTFYFNITADNNDLEWFSATVYYYNETTDTWDILYTENVTTQSSGGTISYTISDTNISLISGKYKIEAWYKKEGYSAFEVTQTGSTLVFLEYGGFGDSPVWDYIPDWVYLLVTLIIMALVMAVLLPIAGLATGYIGIGIFAVALMLKPDLIMDSGISGWAILTLTALLYTIALFIWSRI